MADHGRQTTKENRKGRTAYKCPLCNQTLSRNEHLQRHIREKHDGERSRRIILERLTQQPSHRSVTMVGSRDNGKIQGAGTDGSKPGSTPGNNSNNQSTFGNLARLREAIIEQVESGNR